MNFFQITQINDKLIAITTLTGEVLYLLKGEKRSILVDTSIGVRGLRKLVENLTDNPIDVILTHGHVDHAPGAAEFKDVYLSSNDIGIYKEHCQLSVRKEYLNGILEHNLAHDMEKELLKPDPDHKFIPLNDGQWFDLGGLHIECFSMPGHTPGSMVLFIPELRALILGDSCNKSTFIFDENASPLNIYRQNLALLQKRLSHKYDRVYITHHQLEVTPDILQNVLNVCDDVLGGKSDEIPFDFMGQHAFIAKAIDNKFNRLDGIDGNIIYDKNKLFSN